VFNEQPLPEVESWLAIFAQSGLPVLRHSESEIARLREDQDNTNSRTLAGLILHDPLLSLRVLAYIEEHRRHRQITDITTIDRAIMMIGMVPFFRDFSALPVVEDRLRDHPQALLGLLKAVGRARRAAHWAREWAILRRDMDVDEITLATLLHDLAEMMMWLYAPKLALQFRDVQRAAPTRRSALIQEEVFGLPLSKLKLALSGAWHLPALVVQLLDHRQADNPRVRNVKLAVDLARHSVNGWNDPALPDDFKGIRELLHVNQESLLRHLDVGEEDAQRILAMEHPAD
jgi:HD-like signal output (HDOD) protein